MSILVIRLEEGLVHSAFIRGSGEVRLYNVTEGGKVSIQTKK